MQHPGLFRLSLWALWCRLLFEGRQTSCRPTLRRTVAHRSGPPLRRAKHRQSEDPNGKLVAHLMPSRLRYCSNRSTDRPSRRSFKRCALIRVCNVTRTPNVSIRALNRRTPFSRATPRFVDSVAASESVAVRGAAPDSNHCPSYPPNPVMPKAPLAQRQLQVCYPCMAPLNGGYMSDCSTVSPTPVWVSFPSPTPLKDGLAASSATVLWLITSGRNRARNGSRSGVININH